jgi:predicted unusual protein kinase regulating ubiquinone biosynthesis (AarF/ABC1/UbiB family)
MVALRDTAGVLNQIMALAQHRPKSNALLFRRTHQIIAEFIDAMPTSSLPSAADAMRLLESVAMQGLKFPASLIILSKIMLTLEGILGDLVGSDMAMGMSVARHVALHWMSHRSEFRSPLTKTDWFTLQCSALLLASRLGIQWQQTMLKRWLTPKPATAAAS